MVKGFELIGTRWRWRDPENPFDMLPQERSPALKIGPEVRVTWQTEHGDVYLTDPQGNTVSVSEGQLARLADLIVTL